MRKKRRKLLKEAFKNSGADKLFGSFLIFYLIAALIIWIFEPTVNNYFDSLWYCFASISTIGFGDIMATTLLPRIVTIMLWLYATVTLAIFTAVITGYFLDVSKMKANESVQEFLHGLEHLPELSKEELERLSQQVKEFNEK